MQVTNAGAVSNPRSNFRRGYRAAESDSGFAAFADHRQPPASDPYNTQALVPATQEIDVIIEFPDGHTRPFASTTLYVDGQAAAENTNPPFDKFTWNLSGFKTSGEHKLAVQAVDLMGLGKTSVEIPVTVTIIEPPHGRSVQSLQNIVNISPTEQSDSPGVAMLLILLISRLQILVPANTRQSHAA